MMDFLSKKLEKLYARKEIFVHGVNFGSNDYLDIGKSIASRIVGALANLRYGSGVRSSKYIGGYSSLMQKLETLLKTANCTEDAIVFGSGYLADIGMCQVFDSKETVFVADKFIHASYIDGIKYGKLIRFEHNNVEHLNNILAEQSLHKIVIITETVFSMHGDVAPLLEIVNLAQKYCAVIITDNSHGLGVIDAYKNIPEYKMHIKVGTFSKAVGSYGGYACGNNSIINAARSLARTQIYSTALPASVLACNIYGLKKITRLKCPSKALINAQNFTKDMGLPRAQSSIVLLKFAYAQDVYNTLLSAGYYVPLIRPPTLPFFALRLTFRASSKMPQYILRILKSQNIKT